MKNESDEEEVTDSIRLIRVLDKALETYESVDGGFNEERVHENELKQFSTEFDTITGNGFYIKTNLAFGDLFGAERNYLLVKRETSSGQIYIDLFVRGGNGFENLISHETSWLNYDTAIIQDVNGDKYKDLLIKWHAASACCLRNAFEIFLCNENGGFSTAYHFINPTFDRDAKIIRGVCYGHPGETELYKYRWHGLSVDTIEYVYPDEQMEGRYIRSKYPPSDKRNSEASIMRLNSVPIEYKNIDGIDWFMGN